MPSALEAAIEFLENDAARDLLGLHMIRVNGEMMDRAGLAGLLRVEATRRQSLVGGAPVPVDPRMWKALQALVMRGLVDLPDSASSELWRKARRLADVVEAGAGAAPKPDEEVCAFLCKAVDWLLQHPPRATY